jgi:hypothetical protein
VPSPLGGGEDFPAFLGDSDAIDMPRQQRHAQLMFKLQDMAAQGVDRLAQLFGGGAETAPAHHLQEQTDGVPVLHGAKAGWRRRIRPLFVLRNTPVA